jgi:hypothetical protein
VPATSRIAPAAGLIDFGMRGAPTGAVRRADAEVYYGA